MRSTFGNSFASRPAVLRGGLSLLAAMAVLLPFAGRGFAATPAPTNASLSGAYVFHITNVKEAYWYKSKSCTYSIGTFEYAGGGQAANTEIINGEATFDGKGHVTITADDLNRFNSTASSNTVIIPPCPSKPGAPLNINNGHMVDESMSLGTIDATYAVESNGSGTITLPDGQGTLSLNLAAFNSAGVSMTVLMINPNGDANDPNLGTGIAIHK
jgi:hypothetical protein